MHRYVGTAPPTRQRAPWQRLGGLSIIDVDMSVDVPYHIYLYIYAYVYTILTYNCIAHMCIHIRMYVSMHIYIYTHIDGIPLCMIASTGVGDHQHDVLLLQEVLHVGMLL